MPLINVKVIEGVFSSSQRREIVQKLTDAMVSIEGENMRGVTWCVLEEVHSGDWAIGGNALTTQDVQALAAGAAARGRLNRRPRAGRPWPPLRARGRRQAASTQRVRQRVGTA